MMLCATVAMLLAVQQEVRVRFDGVHQESVGDLRMTIERDLERYVEDPRATVLDDAAFRISNRYRLLGYHFVKVTVGVEAGVVVFTIIEGPQVALGRVHFRGHAALSEKELEEALPRLPGGDERFSLRLLAVQSAAIVDAYHRRGYLDVRLSPPALRFDPATSRMNVTFEIEEGRYYEVARVDGDGLDPDTVGRFVGRPYTPEMASELEAAVADGLREQGHPFAAAEVQPRVDRERGEVVLRVSATPGPVATVGNVTIAGAERTKKRFVKERAHLFEGEIYRLSELRQAEDRLRETGLFTSVRVVPGAFQEDARELTLEIQLEEREAGEVSLRGGYGTSEGLRLGGDIAYRNVLGRGEMGRLSATYSRFGVRPDVEVVFPYLFGSELSLGATAHYEEREYPSFDAVSYGAFPSLSIPLAEGLDIVTGVRFAIVRTDEVEEFIPPGDRLDFDYRALSVAVTWDRRDSPMLPTRGTLLGALGEWTGGLFDSDIQFAKISGTGKLFLPLAWGMVVAGSVRGGVIAPIEDTDEIPIALRFFAGGTNTVRGFDFGMLGPLVGGDPTGGEVFLSSQLEVRFPIWKELHGAIFTDRGGVWFEREDVDLDETRYCVGVGLRYYTPAGALVADVAWNVSDEEDEDDLEMHLSIGFPF